MRLGMMDVLELFKGEATLEHVGVGVGWSRASYADALSYMRSDTIRTHTLPPSDVSSHNPSPPKQVLEAAAGDRYATARASLAAALYFEARGDGHCALPLLRAVAELDGDAGDGALRGLARCHLRVLEARLGGLVEEVEAQPAGPKVVGEEEKEQEQEKGERGSFWGALVTGAWGGVRMPSVLDSSDGTVSVSSSGSLSSSRSWCGRSSSGSGDEGVYDIDEVEVLRKQPPVLPGRRARSCRH